MERSGYFSICDTPPLITSNAVSGFSFRVCRVFDISIEIFIASLHVVFYLMIVYLVITLYIFAPYSRILGFWLTSFLIHDLNKVYLILSYNTPSTP